MTFILTLVCNIHEKVNKFVWKSMLFIRTLKAQRKVYLTFFQAIIGKALITFVHVQYSSVIQKFRCLVNGENKAYTLGLSQLVAVNEHMVSLVFPL